MADPLFDPGLDLTATHDVFCRSITQLEDVGHRSSNMIRV
jgi:hypothetical protein